MAIEGVDGCGKTTQAKMLVDRLKKTRYEAMYIRPVYALINLSRLGEEDQTSLSPRRNRVSGFLNKKSSFMRRALMGLIGYFYALTSYIFINIHYRNKIIVCDRYFYQFFFDLFGSWSENIIKFFPKPDITFFLDGDLDLFYSRMDNSFDASVSRDYYSEVVNLYKKISQKYGFVQIDANLEREKINDTIFRAIKEKVGAKHNE